MELRTKCEKNGSVIGTYMRKISYQKALQFTLQFPHQFAHQFPHQRRRTICTVFYGKVDERIDELVRS